MHWESRMKPFRSQQQVSDGLRFLVAGPGPPVGLLGSSSAARRIPKFSKINNDHHTHSRGNLGFIWDQVGMGSSQDLTRVLYAYAMFIFLTSVSAFIFAGFEAKAKTAVSAKAQSNKESIIAVPSARPSFHHHDPEHPPLFLLPSVDIWLRGRRPGIVVRAAHR